MPSTGQGAARALAPVQNLESCYLLPETVANQDGLGPVVSADPKPTVLTLAITTAVDQEQLDVSVWGSTDGENWGDRPVAKFCHKSYCGSYNLPVDLSRVPGVRHLRVKWEMSRWGGERGRPLFGFYVAMA
ncbi:MAG TPA: hypothetical protein VGL53_26810 [Bryobacteraceae bacterium]